MTNKPGRPLINHEKTIMVAIRLPVGFWQKIKRTAKEKNLSATHYVLKKLGYKRPAT